PGSIAGPVTMAAGGTLSPGNSLGQLTMHSSIVLASGSAFQVALNGATAGTGYAQLVLLPGSSLDLGGPTLNPLLTYAPSAGDKLFVIDNQNTTGGLLGSFNGQPNLSTVNLGTFSATISYSGDRGSQATSGGNDVVLFNFVPVPEPANLLLLAAAALA